MIKLGWQGGVAAVEESVRLGFSIPERKEVDLFVLVKDKAGKVSAVNLEWNDHHQCLSSWIEGVQFDGVRSLVDKYLTDQG